MVRLAFLILTISVIVLIVSLLVSRHAIRKIHFKDDAMQDMLNEKNTGKAIPVVEKSQSDLTVGLEMAILSALNQENEYLFQIFTSPETPASLIPCIRIYRRNNYLLDICAVNGFLMEKISFKMGRAMTFIQDMTEDRANRPILTTASLDEAFAKIRSLPGNFGFEFFMATVRRLT